MRRDASAEYADDAQSENAADEKTRVTECVNVWLCVDLLFTSDSNAADFSRCHSRVDCRQSRAVHSSRASQFDVKDQSVLAVAVFSRLQQQQAAVTRLISHFAPICHAQLPQSILSSVCVCHSTLR